MNTVALAEVLARINAPFSEEEKWEQLDESEVPTLTGWASFMVVYAVASGCNTRESLTRFVQGLYALKLPFFTGVRGTLDDVLGDPVAREMIECEKEIYAVTDVGLYPLRRFEKAMRRFASQYRVVLPEVLQPGTLREKLAAKLASADLHTLVDVAKFLKLE